MITEGVVRLLAGLVSVVGNLMPNLDTPGFFGNVSDAVASIAGVMAPLGTWVPFAQAGNASAFVFAALGVGLVVKVVRIVASFLTAGGGSAS